MDADDIQHGEDALRVELDPAAARGPYKPANSAVQVDAVTGEVRLDDFVAYMPEKAKYVCLPTGDLWPGTSVDAAVPPVDEGGEKPTPASKWLSRNRRVEQMTWRPGEPQLIRDKVVREGGWIDQGGYTVLNLYKPPVLPRRNGDPESSGSSMPIGSTATTSTMSFDGWRTASSALTRRSTTRSCSEELKGSAKTPARAREAGNRALELHRGDRRSRVSGGFNGFLKSVILRVNEARDLGEFNRYALYDHTKAFMASPPDTLRIDEKNRQEYAIFNVLAAVITTNHKADGIFLPEDDRRHFVAWSDRTKADFDESYWRRIWRWYEHGGYETVATISQPSISPASTQRHRRRNAGLLGDRQRLARPGRRRAVGCARSAEQPGCDHDRLRRGRRRSGVLRMGEGSKEPACDQPPLRGMRLYPRAQPHS